MGVADCPLGIDGVSNRTGVAITGVMGISVGVAVDVGNGDVNAGGEDWNMPRATASPGNRPARAAARTMSATSGTNVRARIGTIAGLSGVYGQAAAL